MYIKTDVQGLVKDEKSGAILNVDNDKLIAYKKKKAFFEEKRSESERIKKVENDLQSIKDMLQELLRDRNK